MVLPTTGIRLRRVLCVLWAAAFAVGRLANAAPSPGEHGSAADPDGRTVHIVGNQVLADPVILWVMDLPAPPQLSVPIARRAGRRLARFFRQTGYALARVKTFVRHGALWVFVDEGVLDDIVVVGASNARTAQIRVRLELPGNVYNSQYVADILQRLQGEPDLLSLEAELVQTGTPLGGNIPVERLVAAFDRSPDTAVDAWYRDAPDYLLKVTAITPEWDRGFGVGASILGPYGLAVSGEYADTHLLFDVDRYRLSAEVGGFSKTLFTTASVELFYAFPEFLHESLRPSLAIGGDLDNTDRNGLGLDNYLSLKTSGVVTLGYEARQNLVISPGIGYRCDTVFDVSRSPQTPGYVRAEQRQYPIGQLGLEWLVGREGLRRDKQHLLEALIEVRPLDGGVQSRLEGDYQKAWQFGSHDLFVRSNFFGSLGQHVKWYNEEPLASQVLRAVAGDREFGRHLLAVGGEFRLGLRPDFLQVGLSASTAAAGLTNRRTGTAFLAWFASGGPGLHIQLLDNFQLNLFYHVGWRADGQTTGRFSLEFWKIH